MSIIKFPILYAGSQGEKRLSTLFDSGANLSCINEDQISIAHAESLGRERLIATAAEGHFSKINKVIRLDFYIDDVLLSDEFLVVPNLSEEVIIGAAIPKKSGQKWRIKLDFEQDKVIVIQKWLRCN